MVHVIHHLVIGGLENGLVNLINRIPSDRYRHAIVCMADYSDFSLRIQRDDVQIYAMHKKDGQDFGLQGRLFMLFRRIRPDLIHSRNLTALDSLLPGTLAGVPYKIHGEHGRDVSDLEGKSSKHRWLRRLYRPMVDHYVALSKDLERYLQDGIGVPQKKITQIYNGVDTDQFYPAPNGREPLPWSGGDGEGIFVIGTVGRMQAVKDPMTLARAFVQMMQTAPLAEKRLRLVMVGDGPLREQVQAFLNDAGVAQYAWLPGARDDVARMMRGLDLFVLPSLAEGISNTILEAMACGLPVLATAVGGNPELIEEGRTGQLVPRSDPEAMARAMLRYYADPAACRNQGMCARHRAEHKFSMTAMVNSYINLYDRILKGEKR
ncbi:MAG: TIGR03088 family PEP-CTERM/XrtA system glycosyltransferase [Betaproteobacteria bacterium]